MKPLTQQIINDLENMLDIAETTQNREKLNQFNTTVHLLEVLEYDIGNYQKRGNEVDKKIPSMEGYYK